MKLTHIASALLVVTAAFSAAAQAQNIAIVNGKAIPKSRLDAFVKQIESRNEGRAVPPEMMQQVKKALISRELMAQEAERLGLAASADYKSQMDMMRGSVLAGLLVNKIVAEGTTDDKLQAKYQEFTKANGGKEIKASHILVEKEDDAKAIITQIKGGAKFEDIAKKVSKDPGSGANGGDLDWANPSNYVPEFAGALLKLSKGQMTDAPVKSQFGWHVIRQDDVREAALPKFEEVKAQLKQTMEGEIVQKYQQALEAKAKIQ